MPTVTVQDVRAIIATSVGDTDIDTIILAAQRIYALFGFRPVGIRRNYYQEVNEDALIMWLDGVREPERRRRLRELANGLPDGIRP